MRAAKAKRPSDHGISLFRIATSRLITLQPSDDSVRRDFYTWQIRGSVERLVGRNKKPRHEERQTLASLGNPNHIGKLVSVVIARDFPATERWEVSSHNHE
jgi:hypothetical protein